MFDPTTFIAFLMAAMIIVLIPGPGQALVLSQVVCNGKRHGVMTTFGLNVGTLFHALCMAIGLSALLSTFTIAYEVVKFSGALYLIYLGISSFRRKENKQELETVALQPLRNTFVQGIYTGILNPKVALFFVSFLPQFVNPTKASPASQFLVLGSIIALLCLIWDLVLITLLSRVKEKVFSSNFFKNKLHKILALVYVSLGIKLLFSGKNS